MRSSPRSAVRVSRSAERRSNGSAAPKSGNHTTGAHTKVARGKMNRALSGLAGFVMGVTATAPAFAAPPKVKDPALLNFPGLSQGRIQVTGIETVPPNKTIAYVAHQPPGGIFAIYRAETIDVLTKDSVDNNTVSWNVAPMSLASPAGKNVIDFKHCSDGNFYGVVGNRLKTAPGNVDDNDISGAWQSVGGNLTNASVVGFDCKDNTMVATTTKFTGFTQRPGIAQLGVLNFTALPNCFYSGNITGDALGVTMTGNDILFAMNKDNSGAVPADFQTDVKYMPFDGSDCTDVPQELNGNQGGSNIVNDPNTNEGRVIFDSKGNGWLAREFGSYFLESDPLAAPTISNIALTSSVDENGIATLTGNNTSAGNVTLTIDWKDGAPEVIPNVPPGAFSIPHQYTDDAPSGTPVDKLAVTVTASDNNGSSAPIFANIDVKNVAPKLSNVKATAVNVGSSTIISGNILEPSPEDTFQITVEDWDDGSPASTINRPAGSTDFMGMHNYAAPGNYNIKIKIADDDTGTDTITIIAKVSSSGTSSSSGTGSMGTGGTDGGAGAGGKMTNCDTPPSGTITGPVIVTDCAPAGFPAESWAGIANGKFTYTTANGIKADVNQVDPGTPFIFVPPNQIITKDVMGVKFAEDGDAHIYIDQVGVGMGALDTKGSVQVVVDPEFGPNLLETNGDEGVYAIEVNQGNVGVGLSESCEPIADKTKVVCDKPLPDDAPQTLSAKTRAQLFVKIEGHRPVKTSLDLKTFKNVDTPPIGREPGGCACSTPGAVHSDTRQRIDNLGISHLENTNDTGNFGSSIAIAALVFAMIRRRRQAA